MMCCENTPRRIGGDADCACGCCRGSSFRRFYSSKEKRERLESYRDALKKELAGVEEHLNEVGEK